MPSTISSHVGEVPPHVPIVVDVDRAAFGDRFGELEVGHVGAPPGAVDGEKAQARGRQPVEMAVGVGHQLVRFLGGGIEADRMVGVVARAEGPGVVQAVDRGARGVHKVRRFGAPAAFQDIQEPHDVRVDVVAGMVDAVPDPRLGGEVDHSIEGFVLEQGFDRRPVLELHPDEAKPGIFFTDDRLAPALSLAADPQFSEPRELELGIVVGVDRVDANHRIAAIQKPFYGMEADETGRAGHENMHNFYQLILISGRTAFYTPRSSSIPCRPGHAIHHSFPGA